MLAPWGHLVECIVAWNALSFPRIYRPARIQRDCLITGPKVDCQPARPRGRVAVPLLTWIYPIAHRSLLRHLALRVRLSHQLDLHKRRAKKCNRRWRTSDLRSAHWISSNITYLHIAVNTFLSICAWFSQGSVTRFRSWQFQTPARKLYLQMHLLAERTRTVR